MPNELFDDVPELVSGEISPPTATGVSTPHEDAIIGDPEDIEGNPHEPFREDDAAKEYFESVTYTEAMNYLMFLHDTHALSFDRLNELKEMLDVTPSFLGN